jgi:hypothetical protein
MVTPDTVEATQDELEEPVRLVNSGGVKVVLGTGGCRG